MEAVIVTARPGQNGVPVGVQPALKGCRSRHGGAVVVDGRLVCGSSVEGHTVDYTPGLEHRAGTGTQADAGVVCCGAQAVVVVVVEGQ